MHSMKASSLSWEGASNVWLVDSAQLLATSGSTDASWKGCSVAQPIASIPTKSESATVCAQAGVDLRLLCFVIGSIPPRADVAVGMRLRG